MSSILCVNNYHYLRGGAEAVYFAHQGLMQSIGWRTACFAMQHPDNLPSEWSPWFVEEIEYGRHYGLADNLKRAFKVVYSFEARNKLAGLLTRFTPDLAHLHNVYHHLSPAIIPLLKSRGIPVVMTAHDLKLACPSYRMLSNAQVCERCKGGNYLHVLGQRCVKDSLAASAVVALESSVHAALGTWKQLDRVIVPSRFYQSLLAKWGWPGARLAYVPNWLDAQGLAPSTQAGSYFLYAGRLSPEKGVATLLQAAAAAKVDLKIAGTGPIAEAAAKLAQSLGLNVQFLGHLDGERLREVIRAARAVVVPSEWYENAPMAVLEAHALGKPVLGADIGGIPELIQQGQTGWLFPPGDAVSLAQLMRQVMRLTNSQLAAMGHACRQQVLQRFSRQSHLEALLAAYGDVLGKPLHQPCEAGLSALR
jgi:glycosyltransferase involved in cell wall biosynthesis